MSATAIRITAEQYYAVTVEGDRKQLVEGELVVNEPKAIHALLQMRLATALGSWVSSDVGGGLALLPTDVRIDDHNVYGPDLLWFSAERIPADLGGYPEHLPDLCVEIRSASSWRYDIGAKKRVYESAGLAELWLVDNAADVVLVYRRATPASRVFDVALELSAGESLSSPQLPGFSISLDDLFSR